MSKNLYLTTTGPAAGKSAVVLGLMSLLSREIHSVGYFRPIGRYGDESRPQGDPLVELMCSVFDIPGDRKAMVGLSDREATGLITSGRQDQMLERILEAYKSYEKGHDFVLIEGTSYQGPTVPFEFDVNADLARTLAAPVLVVVSGKDRSANDIYDNTILSRERFAQRGCDLLAVIVNRAQAEGFDELVATLKERFQAATIPFAGAMPEEEILARPRMDEIATVLGAEVLYGERYLENLVFGFRIASMQLMTLLERLEPGALVITSGDRADILLGLMASQMSSTTPSLAGVLLSSGLRPTETLDRVIRGLRNTQLPVLLVNTGTYQTAIDVSNVASAITPQSFRKIETARILFEENIDASVIRAGISAPRSARMNPQLFLHSLIEKARSDRRRIVLPEGTEERILRAVDSLRRRNVVDLTLLGNEDEIRDRAAKLKVPLDGVEVIDPATSDRLDAYAAA
jgi:phosphate acetyltransferase